MPPAEAPTVDAVTVQVPPIEGPVRAERGVARVGQALAPGTPVLTLEHVSKRIGSRWIVEDVHMTVRAGEVYGFLGPNGAGKTTTIRMIVGLARPSRGVIRVLGHDVHRDRSAALGHVGTIVENPETYRYLTGRENLIHYARLAGLRGAERQRRIAEVVDIVGLGARIDDKVKRYSLGMRQRLGVAQALLARPKLLVLDEPTNGLDPAGMREFRELIRRLAAEGMAVFVSSHLLSEIEQMCDRVAILKSGRVIAEAKVADMLSGRAFGQAGGGGTAFGHVGAGDDGAAGSGAAHQKGEGAGPTGLSRARVRVRLHVAPPVEALRALREAGVEAVPEAHGPADWGEPGVLIASAAPDEVPGLVRRLVAAGVDVHAVQPEQDTLEDLFLQLTAAAADGRGEGADGRA
ncbi:MAG: ABC transporter ATP-binding protein [Alicyclobacillaceae bacterium]|nr:ABC transporter ATP-binding protein [Alicyclobacillaceae bacterium]